MKVSIAHWWFCLPRRYSPVVSPKDRILGQGFNKDSTKLVVLHGKKSLLLPIEINGKESDFNNM